jgi:hypothetical protein
LKERRREGEMKEEGKEKRRERVEKRTAPEPGIKNLNP